jgi:hypothetical protein
MTTSLSNLSESESECRPGEPGRPTVRSDTVSHGYYVTVTQASLSTRPLAIMMSELRSPTRSGLSPAEAQPPSR